MMEKDLIDIIREKSFVELSAQEKLDLKEFCASEEEYNQIKEVFEHVDRMEFQTPQPRKETKESLDQLFEQKHPKASPVWYSSLFAVVVPKDKPFYKQPLVHVAAAGLLLLLLIPSMNDGFVQEDVQLASNDTLEQTLDTQETPEKEVEKSAEVTKNEEDKIVDQLDENEVKSLELRDERTSTRAIDPQFEESTMSLSSQPAATGAKHPDGIFKGTINLSLSQSAQEEPAMLDLLTATF